MTFVVLLVGASGWLIMLSPLPFTDLPNHLARAAIMADLLFQDGREFGHAFSFTFELSPYIGGDLLNALLYWMLGPQSTAAAIAILSLVSMPLGTYVVARAFGATRAAACIAGLFAIYFSFDYMLAQGYLHSRMAIGLGLLTVAACADLHIKTTPARWLLFPAVLVASYAMHLSAFVIAAAVSGVLCLMISLSARRVSAASVFAIAVIGALGIWHVYGHSSVDAGGFVYRSLGQKLGHVMWNMLRYDVPGEDALARLALLFGLSGALVVLRIRSDQTSVWLASGTAVLVAVYLLLPEGMQPRIADVDVRALPYLYSLSAIAAAHWWSRKAWGAIGATALGAVIAVSTLALSSAPVSAQSAFLKQYRDVSARIPAGAAVLPVTTIQPPGRIDAYGHAAAFATVDASALTPYLFAGAHGQHLGHFAYRHPFPVPKERWYRLEMPMPMPDWLAYTAAFDYLIITKPFEIERLPLCISLVHENGAAALFRIRADEGCGSAEAGAR